MLIFVCVINIFIDLWEFPLEIHVGGLLFRLIAIQLTWRMLWLDAVTQRTIISTNVIQNEQHDMVSVSHNDLYWTFLSLESHLFLTYDDVMKWKPFPHYWPCVRGIQQWSADCPHEGQYCWTSMHSLLLTTRQTVEHSSWRSCETPCHCNERAGPTTEFY